MQLNNKTKAHEFGYKFLVRLRKFVNVFKCRVLNEGISTLPLLAVPVAQHLKPVEETLGPPVPGRTHQDKKVLLYFVGMLLQHALL